MDIKPFPLLKKHCHTYYLYHKFFLNTKKNTLTLKFTTIVNSHILTNKDNGYYSEENIK